MKYNTIIFDYADTIAQSHKLLPFTKTLFPELYTAGYRLAILSNSIRYGDALWLRNQLTQENLIQYFELITSSHALLPDIPNTHNPSNYPHALLSLAKPTPAIFQRLLNYINTSPQRTVFVGDSFQNDILASQTLGMAALLTTAPNDFSSELWKLLDDNPTNKRPNLLTSYTTSDYYHLTTELKHLTEPLSPQQRILLRHEERIIKSFSPPHTKTDILNAHHELVQIELE